MKNVLIIAGKEIQEGLRNRWVLATTLLLAALALTLTFLGSAPTGNVGAGALDVLDLQRRAHRTRFREPSPGSHR